MAGSYHHGNLRAALVEEALRRVRERGAGNVSLRALAGAVGVSPSAAYQHFGDKDTLLATVGQAGFAQLTAAMRSARSAVGGDDDAAAVARLVAAGAAYVGFATAEPHLFRLMFSPLCTPPEGASPVPRPAPAPEEQADPAHAAFHLLEELLADLDARGLLRVPADPALHLTIWSLVHGFATLTIDSVVDPAAGPAVLDVVRHLLTPAVPAAAG